MSANEHDAATGEKPWGEKRAAPMPPVLAASDPCGWCRGHRYTLTFGGAIRPCPYCGPTVPTPMPSDYRPLAARIHRLFGDLRRHREAWADIDVAGALEAANPDLAGFNRENNRRFEVPETDVLVDFVAGMIGEELKGAKS